MELINSAASKDHIMDRLSRLLSLVPRVLVFVWLWSACPVVLFAHTHQLLFCAVAEGFSADVPLYDEIEGKIIGSITINPTTRKHEYSLSVTLGVHTGTLFWSVVRSRKSEKILGYMRLEDAPVKCVGRGF